MKDIEILKEKFRNAKNDKEFAEIDKEMEALSMREDFAEKMLESIKETNRDIQDYILKEKLKDILPAISVSHLAKTYFNKTPQWFYQRLNGNLVNGKPANFTQGELRILADALTDISRKIEKSVALVV